VGVPDHDDAAEPANTADHDDAGEPNSAALIGFVAAAGAQIDRLFRAAMGAAGRFGGPRLRSRYGPGAGELLIDFRTVLAAPGGFVTAAGLAEVSRYGDPVEIEASVQRAIDRGAIDRDRDGAIRATSAGHAFLDDLYAIQAEALRPLWAGASEVVDRLAAVAGDLVAVASRDPVLAVGAFTAMTPNYEPGGTPPPVILLNRLSALRYHRSDAHALAWRSAGLTAPQMVAIQASDGPRRDAIEERTNEIAAPPFRFIDTDRRHAFLDDLRSVPVPD
jgi:hypothetical protein